MPSTLVTISDFGGGHAQSVRTHNNNEAEFSKNFDIFQDSKKLIPFPDSIAETTYTETMADVQITDIDYTLVSSSYVLRGVGFENASSNKATFWAKSVLVGAVQWMSDAVAAGGPFVKGTGIVYKDKLYAVSAGRLVRYDSAGVVTDIGVFLSTIKLFIHPEDNVLYGISGTTIYRYDGSSITTCTTLLPIFSAMAINSVTDYGTYLAIGMTPIKGSGNSVVYLWGRDMTVTTFQGIIDFGEGSLLILENLNNNLFAVMQPQSGFSAFVNKIDIKQYSGGAVETIKSLVILSTQTISTSKVKNGNKLYFGLSNDDCVYAFGKNKEGTYILTKDRYFANGIMGNSLTPKLSMIGDVLWRAIQTVSSVYVLMRSLVSSGESLAYTSISIYRTTINSNMPIADRYQLKQLEAIQIAFTGKASGNVKVKYSVDGSSWVTIIDQNTTAIEDSVEATNENDGTPFLEGQEIQFEIWSTGGCEIKSLMYKYNKKTTTL